MDGRTEQGLERRRADSLVTFEGVTRRFGDVTAVDGLTLDLQRGQTVALLGPNGAGKTTTVELLLGLLAPDTGVVRLFGGSPPVAIARGRVGAMLQDADVPPGVTATELIQLVRRLHPDPLSLRDTLELTGLDQVPNTRTDRLSGGQRQRLRLALALAGNPELLVLDEPTATLDVEVRRAFWARVRRSVTEGRALLFTTHRLEEAERVADRVVLIVDGRVIADGSVEQVRAQARGRTAVRFSAEGLSAAAVARLAPVDAVEVDGMRLTAYTRDPDATVRALLDQAPSLHDLEITRGGLEEAFLALTGEAGA